MMNDRIDYLQRFTLFCHQKVQDRYELEIMAEQTVKKDWKEFCAKMTGKR